MLILPLVRLFFLPLYFCLQRHLGEVDQAVNITFFKHTLEWPTNQIQHNTNPKLPAAQPGTIPVPFSWKEFYPHL